MTFTNRGSISSQSRRIRVACSLRVYITCRSTSSFSVFRSFAAVTGSMSTISRLHIVSKSWSSSST